MPPDNRTFLRPGTGALRPVQGEGWGEGEGSVPKVETGFTNRRFMGGTGCRVMSALRRHPTAFLRLLHRNRGEQFFDSGQAAFQFGNARVLRLEFRFELGVQALDGG